jgi:hypothetical protein
VYPLLTGINHLAPGINCVLVTVTEWYHAKRPMQLRPFYDCAPRVLIIPDSSTRDLCSGRSRHLVAKRGETGREMAAEFCISVSPLYVKISLTCCNILRHACEGFTCPPKEVVLRIFMALKTPSLSVGFEPANLGSDDKHNNHYTTENDH